MQATRPVLSMRSLVLAGVAALALGVLGGLAADPEMKPVPSSDWRERYRGSTAWSAATAPDQGYGSGYGWGYGLIGSRAAEFVSAVRYPWEEAGADGEWPEETAPEALDVPIAPETLLERGEGAAAVADALARTSGIADVAVPAGPPVPHAEREPAETAPHAPVAAERSLVIEVPDIPAQ